MTNFLIAASRLGMRTATVGHIGDDAFGRFLSDILQVTGVLLVGGECMKLAVHKLGRAPDSPSPWSAVSRFTCCTTPTCGSATLHLLQAEGVRALEPVAVGVRTPEQDRVGERLLHSWWREQASHGA